MHLQYSLEKNITLNDNIRENKHLISIINAFALWGYKKEQIKLRVTRRKEIKTGWKDLMK